MHSHIVTYDFMHLIQNEHNCVMIDNGCDVVLLILSQKFRFLCCSFSALYLMFLRLYWNVV